MLTSEGVYLPTLELNVLGELISKAQQLIRRLEDNNMGVPIDLNTLISPTQEYLFHHPKWQKPNLSAGFPVELGLYNEVCDTDHAEVSIEIFAVTAQELYSTYKHFWQGVPQEEVFDRLSRTGLYGPYLNLNAIIYIDNGRELNAELLAPLRDLRLTDWTLTREYVVSKFLLSENLEVIPHMMTHTDDSPIMRARMGNWFINSLLNSENISRTL